MSNGTTLGDSSMNRFRTYAIVVSAVMGLAISVSLLAAPKSSDLLTKKQAQELAMTAKTPADHVKLQNYFLALAVEYDAEAADHAGLAVAFRKNVSVGRLYPGSAEFRAKHCDRLSGSFTEAAKDAREIAAEHGKIATASN
jgi:hypothetical protein